MPPVGTKPVPAAPVEKPPAVKPVVKPSGKKPPAPEGPPPRDVIYPTPSVEEKWGDNPVTVEWAKERLGWCEDAKEAARYGVTEPLFKDRNGTNVYCLNNVTNRPLYFSTVVEQLVQEILRKKWSGPNGNGKSVNGETIVLSKTGMIQNGQHSLVAVCIAEQDRLDPKQKHHWEEFWDGPVVIDKVVVYGIDEDDDVVNTMDTAKPRSFADVIYRSKFFPGLTQSLNEKLSSMLDWAVKRMWDRTGVTEDAWAPRRTHAEGLDFIRRHGRLVECVKHIHDAFGEGKTAKVNRERVKPGAASAMMYLMAAGRTDTDDYRTADPPSEKFIDFGLWERAEEFWTLLLGTSPDFKEVRFALEALKGDNDEWEVTSADTLAVLCRAWEVFAADGEFTRDDPRLVPTYTVNESDQTRTLAENPCVGGIDLGAGGGTKAAPTTAKKGGEAGKPPGPDEVKAEAEKIKQENLDRLRNGAPAPAPKPRVPVKPPAKPTIIKADMNARPNPVPTPPAANPPLRGPNNEKLPAEKKADAAKKKPAAKKS